MKNHLGYFEIESEIIRNNPELAREIQANSVVLECRYMPDTTKYRYLAMNMAFHEISQCTKAPDYEVILAVESYACGCKHLVFKGFKRI